MQTRDIDFQSTQPALNRSEIFSAFALGIEHLSHHLHEQFQAGFRHLRLEISSLPDQHSRNWSKVPFCSWHADGMDPPDVESNRQ